MNRRQTVWVVGLASVTLLACPHRADFGKDGAPRSAEDLLARVNIAEAQVISIEGDSKITVESAQGKGSTSMFVSVLHPSRLRLEVLDFFGRPQGALVTDGQTCALHDAQHARFFRGPASPANLGRLLPVAIPPAELVALMLGRAPRIPQESLEMRFDEDTQLLVLVLRRGPVTQTLHVHPPEYRVVKSHVEGLAAYDVTFEGIQDIGRLNYPRRVVLVSEAGKTRAQLDYKDVTVNQTPDLTTFELEVPPNVPELEVDERGLLLDGGVP